MKQEPINVLHLEDSDLDAEIIRERLALSGLNLAIQRVADRAGFETSIQHFRYDVVLSDFRVPGFDEFEALDLCKKYLPNAPFLFVSGVIGEEVAVETLRRGATDYLLKERLARLGPAISRAIAEAKERDARKRDEERLKLLWEAAAAILSTDDPGSAFKSLLPPLCEHLCFDMCAAFLRGDRPDQGQITGFTESPPTRDGVDHRVILQEVLGDLGSARRRPMIAGWDDRETNPHMARLLKLGLRSFVCLPLVAAGRWLGVLFFGSRERDCFGPEEVGFLEAISHYVAIAYERLRLIEELRDGDRRKDEFLATLAHELRNPLAPIRNSLQIIKMSDERALRDRAREMMERQIGHMVHLIDDLLDLSRITRGKLSLRREPIDLAHLVQQAVDSTRPLVESRQHSLKIEALSAPLAVHGDPTRLAQVFTNLLSNAAKYTNPGGAIRVTLRDDGECVEARVTDTGVGIPDAMLPRVFDMFTQVDTSLEKAQGGLGIGLTLVKRLVEMHGGSVAAASDGPGRGSEFTVRLPRRIDAIARGPGTPGVDGKAADDAPRQAIRKILVADDNPDGAESLALMLRLVGNDVRTASDGAEALTIAASFRPDVALLDIGMPRFNGHEVARRLRAEEWGKSMIIVAVTGWGQEDDRVKSLEAGCDFHLVKPVDPAELDRALARGS